MRIDFFAGMKSMAHLMSPDTACFVVSDEYDQAIRRLSKDMDVQGWILGQLLDKLALCPIRVRSPEDVVLAQTNGGMIIHVEFHGVINPFNWLELSVNRANQLLEAVASNLGSNMYRAAKAYRRLQSIAGRLIDRAYAKEALMAETLVSDRTCHEAREAAEEIAANWREQRERTIRDRLLSLQNVAQPLLVGQPSFSVALAEFLKWHLPIIGLDEN